MTATNATSGWLGFTTASGTNLFAQDATLATLVANEGSFTDVTSTNWFGFATASGTALTALNLTANQATILSGAANLSTLTWTNGTGTNTTSTNLFATNFTATNGTIDTLNSTNGTITNLTATNGTTTNSTSTNLFAANANFTNATTGWLGATTVSTTNLYVAGQLPCLADGTNCLPTAPSSSTLQDVTNYGNTTTNAIQFAGGTSTADFTVQGTLTATNGSFTDLTASNGTTTNSTSTNLYANTGTIKNVDGNNLSYFNATSTNWLGFATASGTTLTALNLNANNATILGGTAIFSNATSTNFVATNLSATNATVTALLAVNGNFTNVTSGWIGATTVSTSELFVNGLMACLEDGTNCQSVVVSLQEVTDVGNVTTNTIQFAGGTSTGPFDFVTGGFVLGAIYPDHITFNTATDTTSGFGGPINLISSDAFGGSDGFGGDINLLTGQGDGTGDGGWLQFFAGAGGSTGSGGELVMQAGNAGSGGNGNGGSVEITAGRGFGSGSAGRVDITGGFNVASGGAGGSVTIRGGNGNLVDGARGQVILAPGKGASGAPGFVTIDPASAASQTTILRFMDTAGEGSNRYVGFRAPSTVSATTTWTLPGQDGMNGQVLTTNGSGTLSWSTVSSGSTTPTLQQVTDQGNTTTDAIQFAGGTSTADFTVQGTLTATNGSFTSVTASNGTTTNSTSTNLFATNLTATNGTVTTLGSTNGTITNLTTTNATSGWLGFTTASGTTLTALNLNANNATILGGTAIFSNATSTNFVATTLTASNATVTTLVVTDGVFTNVTSSWIGASTVSTTNLYVNGQLACLADGTNCSPIATSFQAVTDVGNTTTNAIQFAGGTSTNGFDFLVNEYLLASIQKEGINFQAATTVDGNGSSVTVYGGSAVPGTSGYGGDIFMQAGTGDATSTGGFAYLLGGSGGDSGDGGDVYVSAGQGGAVGLSNGGTAFVRGGAGNNGGVGGDVSIKAGDALYPGGVPGTVSIEGGSSQEGRGEILLRPGEGSVTSTGFITIQNSFDQTTMSALRFMELEANGSNYVAFRATSSLATSTIWTLPVADGSDGQVLTTDGFGNLSWSTSTGGSSATPTLQQVTDQGAVTTNAIQFAGGTSTANFAFQQGVTWLNATGTNTTSTKLAVLERFSQLISGSTGFKDLGEFDVNTDNINNIVYDVEVRGRYAYAVSQGTGASGTFAVINTTSFESPSSTARISTFGSNPCSMAFTGQVAYVANCLDSTKTLFEVVDLASPGEPAVVGAVTGSTSTVFAIAVAGGKLFLTTTAAGVSKLSIYDLANPANPSLISVTNLSGSTSPYGLAVQGNFVYVTFDQSSNFSVIDISNAASPTEHGPFSAGVLLPYGITVQGSQAFITSGFSTGIQLVDITTSTSPVLTGTLANGGGSNSNGLAVRGRYLFSSTGRIYDISNQWSPVQVASFSTGLSADRALDVSGSLAVYGGRNGGGIMRVWDLGGAEFGNAMIAALEAGGLQVRGSATIGNGLTVDGAASIGGRLGVRGDLSLGGDLNTSGTINTASLLVNSQTVCLTDGTNCPTGGSGTFQTVTNNGNVTTNTIQFAGGTSTGVFDFVVNGNLLASIYPEAISLSTATDTTSGFGGTINLTSSGAAAGSDGFGGDVNLNTGAGDGLGDGGWLQLYTGDGGDTGSGGNIVLQTGTAGSSGNGNGGNFELTTGNGRGTGHGGNISFLAGANTTSNGIGGMISLVAGNGNTSNGTRGQISLRPGNGPSDQAGFVTLLPPVSTASTTILRFMDAGGEGANRYVGFRAPGSISATSVWTLPGADGTNGQALTTNGSGILSWSTLGGTPSLQEVTTQGNTTTNAIEFAGGTSTGDLSVLTKFNQLINATSTFTDLGTVNVGAGNVYKTAIVGRMVYAISGNSSNGYLTAVDLTNFGAPSSVHQIAIEALNPHDLEVAGHYAYVTNWVSGSVTSSVLIYDISDPGNMVQVGGIPYINSQDNYTSNLQVVGNYLYVTAGATVNLSIYDLSNPIKPVRVSRFFTASGIGNLSALRVQGKYAYTIGDGSAFVSAIDISNPYNPVEVNTFHSNPNWGVTEIETQGSQLFLGDGGPYLGIYGAATGSAPVFQSQTVFGVNGAPKGMVVQGRYVFSSNGKIFDVTDGYNPVLVKSFAPGASTSIEVQGRLAVYGSSGGDIRLWDMGGTEISNLIANTAEVGGLQVRGDTTVGGTLTIQNGLDVGGAGQFNSIGAKKAFLYETLFGGVSSSTGSGIGAYFDTRGNLNGTSTVYFGYATNTNVVIGGTSTTDLGLSSSFFMDGDDLFVHGNIGSVSSVYTNGAFVAGTSSTYYGDGYLTKTNGNYFLSISGGVFAPSTDLGVSLGSSAYRFNGEFGSATATSVTSTNLFATNGNFTSLSATNFSPAAVNTTNLVATNATTTNGTTTNLTVLKSISNRLPVGSTLTKVGQISTSSSPAVIKVEGHYAYVATNGSPAYLSVFDISNPLNPLEVSTISVSSSVESMAVQGQFLILLERTATMIQLIDVSDPSNPAIFFTGAAPASPKRAAINGRYYAATLTGLAIILDGNNPRTKFDPVSIISGFLSDPYAVVIQDRYLYVTDIGNDSLSIVDMSTPSNLKLMATTTTDGSSGTASQPRELIVRNGYAYAINVNNTSATIGVIDVSKPTAPQYLTGIATSYFAVDTNSVTVSGNYLYLLGNDSKVHVFDLSNPALPVEVAATPFMPTTGQGIAVQGRYVYAAIPSFDRFDIFDINGIETGGLVAESAQIGALKVDGSLYAGGKVTADSLVVGSVGLLSHGSISVSATGTTSTILGNLIVGTSTRPGNVMQNSAFAFNGQDLFVGGSIGSVSSVYSNSAFIAGPGNGGTRFGSGEILQTGTNDLRLGGGSGFLTPTSTGAYSIGKDTARFNAFFNGVTTTDLLVQGLATIQTLQTVGSFTAADMLATNVTSTNLDVFTRLGATYSTFTVNDATTPAISVVNQAGATDQGWGGYINRLLVGTNGSASTGTFDYDMVIAYDGVITSGLCLDDTSTPETCLTDDAISISADGAINATAFDLAEWYRASGSVTSTDLLVVDSSASTTVMASTGVAYDPRLIGIASTRPGLLLGRSGDVRVALSGRVPTKVTVSNGEIQAGDPLTSSLVAGTAMKATKPGMIVGYALESATTDGVIEVFVKPGWNANGLIATNTSGTEAIVNDALTLDASSAVSSTNLLADSWGLTFRGDAYNVASSTIESQSFQLFADILSTTSSQLTIASTSGTSLFSLNQVGDLMLGGKLYPAKKSGGMQADKYIFLDDTLGPGTSTYIATNADGWQANDSYDFAERYYSPDALDSGDLVTMSEQGQLHVQRTWEVGQTIMGIVSTRPAFVAGAPATSTYPIALSGRVPTKVSTQNGDIHVGDPLTASTVPGVAVKATAPGPIVGYALQATTATDITKIEVFVNPGWWGANQVAQTSNQVSMATSPTVTRRGQAIITMGMTDVTVNFTTMNAYPSIQVTPYDDAGEGWWMSDVTDRSFKLHLRGALPRDVRFAWKAEPSEGDSISFSDGTTAQMDSLTGQPVHQTQATSTEPVPEPLTEPVTSTEPVVPPTEEPLPPSEPTAPSSTEPMTEATSTTP